MIKDLSLVNGARVKVGVGEASKNLGEKLQKAGSSGGGGEKKEGGFKQLQAGKTNFDWPVESSSKK